MEALTRLVTESLARHGFDRPVDYRRLHWSRWFRCESHHSLLLVPSQPGVFAIAEEIASVGTDAFVRPAAPAATLSSATATAPTRRMLAVTQFFEDDDMAFVLDRMLSRDNPMRARLTSGRYFVRFVVIEEESQRRSICAALNQWMANSAEKATGIGSHFATSLELTPATEYVREAEVNDAQANLFATADHGGADALVRRAAESATLSDANTHSQTTPHLNSGAATNIHCPTPLPSGF
jgi:hypothetical protein